MGTEEEDDQKTPRPPPGSRSTTRWTATVAIELAELWLLLGNDDEPCTWMVKGSVVLVQLVRALAGKQ